LKSEIEVITRFGYQYRNVKVICPEVEQQLLCQHFERQLKAEFAVALAQSKHTNDK
jgi:hypothetical protein